MNELAALLKAARNLDKTALATIFDMYSPALYKFISRLVHDPVLSDQIIADVFVELVEELGAGRGPRTNIRTYLYQIAYRLVLERFRDQHPHAALEVVIRRQEKNQPAAQAQMDERVMMEALLSSMNTELSEDQRIVIILRFLEDFSLKETAEIMGKDVNNVKVIQNRGISKLKKALGMEVDPE
jgi:RNA polymerase sigma-70 factor (ECF subfamily)